MKLGWFGLCTAVVSLTLVPMGASAPTKASVHGTLQGNPIRLASTDPLSLPAGEPAYVAHGWSWPLRTTETEPGWLELLAGERRERTDDAIWRFELYASVDDEAPRLIGLSRSFHFIGVEGNPHFTKIHYVQIPAATYVAGTTVVFKGVWYGDSDDDDISEIEQVRSRAVTFT